MGLLNTGPLPSTKLTPRLKASGIVRISEKSMEASSLNSLIGCIANSQQTSGFLHISMKLLNLFLTSRYSGIYLPACRMYQIGGVSKFSLLSALIKRDLSNIMKRIL